MVKRIPALDGLRGVAALLVLVGHALLLIPTLANAFGIHGPPPSDGLAWWITYTPLHLLWAAGEAVIVFFVLSGYVLTRGTEQWREREWLAYYPRRIARLYLPVVAAVLLAYTWSVLVPRVKSADRSWWMNAHHRAAPDEILHDILLLWHPGTTTMVLWSLRWEVYFSLALPVAAAVAYVVRRQAWAAVALVLTLVAWPGAEPEMRLWIGSFAIGSLLAVVPRPTLSAWWWPVAALLLTAHWMLGNSSWTYAAELAGAMVLVMVAPRSGNLFLNPAVQWAGSRSFSLYLVHEPLVVSAGLLDLPRPVQMTGAVLVSLAVTEVFYRLVEAPATRFSRSIGGTPRPADVPPIPRQVDLTTAPDRVIPDRVTSARHARF